MRNSGISEKETILILFERKACDNLEPRFHLFSTRSCVVHCTVPLVTFYKNVHFPLVSRYLKIKEPTLNFCELPLKYFVNKISNVACFLLISFVHFLM